ncbi:tape measure protein [Cohnella nanjingensis]|uniref:tape measure protein n=1 Tax=Cohnella nanjingensis TaxID=1387779 RepID=UPI001C88D18A|nr:tape measure protein [Cohnella nanjingensis]
MDKVKASPAAKLNDQVSSKVRAAGTLLTGLTRRTWHVTIRAKDLITGTIGSIKSTLFSLPGMLGMAGGIAGGVVAPTNLSGQMEQARIAFETMLGSATKARRLLDDLQDFANHTPFEFPELRDSSKRLLAFGFTAEKIIPMMTGIGNAASGLGLGSEGIGRITLALGQMKAKAKVSADEMLQLTEAGIPAWDILAKRMGISTAQTMKLAEKGLIPATQAIEALIDGMNQRFPNMMDKQSKSLFGLLSNIKDTFNSKILMRWGDGIRTAIQPRFQKLSDWIDNNEAKIKHWGDVLAKSGGQAADWVGRKFEKLISLFDDPTFQNADFFGKMRIAWDKLISDPFAEWWAAGGQAKVNNIAAKMGDAIGGTLGGLIMGALGVAAGDSSADESPFLQAGKVAGKAFLDAFLEAFDAGKIASKASNALADVNMQAIKNPTKGNLINAGLVDAFTITLGSILLGKVLKPIKLIKGLFGKGVATGTAAAGAKVAAEAATRAGAATVAESVVTRGAGAAAGATAGAAAFPKSPYSPGWNPRYVTPPRPGVPLPQTFPKGIPLAGNLVRMFIGPETVPLIAGSLISQNLIQQDLNKKADFKSMYQDNPTMLEWGKLPEWQRFGVNSGAPITRVPEPSANYSQQQVNNAAAYLSGKEITQENKTSLMVHVPAGAVQINMPAAELDYETIMHDIGTNFAEVIRRAYENK